MNMARPGVLPHSWVSLAFAASLAAAPTLCQAASETVIATFNGHAQGGEPNGRLLHLGGKFYGVTYSGGAQNSGTVFFVQTNGHHVVLYSFKGGKDGKYPLGGLVDLGAILYGTTAYGGQDCGDLGCGTVFSITPQGAYKQIYAFHGSADGLYPATPLVVLNGLLYGTALDGGPTNAGAIFSVTPAGAESTLYEFQGGADGAGPNNLITDGTALYGTTNDGAGTACFNSSGCGTVFTIDPQGQLTTLYSFGDGSKGGNPYAPLLKVGNDLYGTTVQGSTFYDGTIFKLSLQGAYKVLYSFDYPEHLSYPNGLIDVGGILYGTAFAQGAHGYGSIFSITKSGTFTDLYDFQGGNDGDGPGDLLAVGNTLYGTTQYGGGKGVDCGPKKKVCSGTVFAFTP